MLRLLRGSSSRSSRSPQPAQRDSAKKQNKRPVSPTAPAPPLHADAMLQLKKPRVRATEHTGCALIVTMMFLPRTIAQSVPFYVRMLDASPIRAHTYSLRLRASCRRNKDLPMLRAQLSRRKPNAAW